MLKEKSLLITIYDSGIEWNVYEHTPRGLNRLFGRDELDEREPGEHTSPYQRRLERFAYAVANNRDYKESELRYFETIYDCVMICENGAAWTL